MAQRTPPSFSDQYDILRTETLAMRLVMLAIARYRVQEHELFFGVSIR